MTQTLIRPQTAVDVIVEMYDKDTLKDIAMHGCASGCASYHIYTSDCVDFYNNHQDEIDEYICDALGYDSVMELTTECADIQHAMNHLCWIFIELVAAVHSDEEDN